MCDLRAIFCDSKNFSTRRFYFGGGISAGASSGKVLNLDPRPSHGCDGTLEIKLIYTCTISICLNVSIVQCLFFHVSVHNVSYWVTCMCVCVCHYVRGCIGIHMVHSSCYKQVVSLMNDITDWHFMKYIRKSPIINMWANNLITHLCLVSRNCVIIGYELVTDHFRG